MSASSKQISKLLDKLDQLPPERISEVEDFVDFLRHKDQDRPLIQVAGKMAAQSFSKVWSNPDDDAYDSL